MIVELTIKHWVNRDTEDEVKVDEKTFLIDTDKVEVLLAKGSDMDGLYYAHDEMERLMRALREGYFDLGDGTDKYSLIDTEWEANMVAPSDPEAKPEKEFSRDVFS